VRAVAIAPANRAKDNGDRDAIAGALRMRPRVAMLKS
jgi:hypothetical protein